MEVLLHPNCTRVKRVSKFVVIRSEMHTGPT
jgi:hypothetical protein